MAEDILMTGLEAADSWRGGGGRVISFIFFGSEVGGYAAWVYQVF